MAYETPLTLSVLGNTIRVSLPAIPPNLVTYLGSPVSSGGTTLSVLDNNPFVQNDYLIIGRPGLDKTEIQLISGAVTPGTSLTVAALTYDHPADAPVSKILWNQVEISGAATVTGSKTVIATISLQPDRSDTVYVDTGTTYAYYFARYKNSTTSTFSVYSAAAAAGGYATNSVRSVKDEALSMVNEIVDGKLITDQWLNNEIFNCEQEVWTERKQWSWAYTFDYILGQVTTGQLSFTLPSDISDTQSNKSILERGVRLGTRPDMRYITKEEFDSFFVQTSHTTLAQDIGLADTTVYLTNVGDFATSGSIQIGTDSNITYTGVNTTLNTLTGVSGQTATHTAGVDVWQMANFAEPVFYTVFNGKLYFQQGVDSTYSGLNLYISYYRKPTAITGDSDSLNIPDFSLYHYYLAYKILLRKNNGQMTQESDRMYQEYEKRKELLKKQDRTGQYVLMRPRLPSIRYPTTEIKTSFLQMDN